MTLADLASLGSFVSGIAVLASLVFLFFQMRQVSEQTRQALKQTRAQIAQGRATRSVDFQLRTADANLATVWARGRNGDEAMSEAELGQFMAYCRALFVSAEESFMQHREGLLPDGLFHTMTRGYPSMMGGPGIQAMWDMTRHMYEPAFVEYIDDIAAQGRAAGYALAIGPAWRERLARFKAVNEADAQLQARADPG